MIIAHLRIYFF